ncbi:ABC transporter substrate-binding protein [Gordonia neofelifaecis]|uniref:Abc transporter substrate binding lipoprotein n=1 Tax=Gordonia neofelifaecis NRRL B-59395 TaxID=644548 RepID=F1YL01_9ACTN|nr:ABC transporter substrate-binding protein [Gordonia neofelifaecis]EGD54606.1 abc transporter substrate binding lipoprotein [Gordonia neofelifaecis NRRL B-59395]
MRTLNNTAVLACAAIVLTVSACSDSSSEADPAGGAISLQNCGRTVSMKQPATAAITVNQGATESALAVGAGGRLAGTAYLDSAIAPQWADAYAEVPVLSDKYPTREAVLEKHPDLVAASYSSAFTDKTLGTQQSFADLGVATYVSPFACEDASTRPKSSWDAVAGENSDYGVLFGRTAEADEVNARMRATLADLTARSTGAGKTVLWWDSATDKPYVGAGQGGPQLVIEATGAKNIFADVPGNWADAGWESVLKADPDMIVLVDADWDTAEAKKKYLESDPALKDLKAVGTGSFVVIPFAEGTPGPRLIDGATKLSDAFAK